MRQARLVIPEHPHHIVLRGNNRRRLFSYPHECRHLIWLVGRALAPCRCLLHALALLHNHVHLMITPAAAEALSEFVKRVAQRYAQLRNRRRGGRGKLFEERYYSKPIADEQHLARTMAYVDLNPVRAGLTARPADYPWSSHRACVGLGGEVPAEMITPTPWYCGLGTSVTERQRHYARWVEQCRTRHLEPDHVDELRLIEQFSWPYTRRLLRPDGSSAREPTGRYRRGGKIRFPVDDE